MQRFKNNAGSAGFETPASVLPRGAAQAAAEDEAGKPEAPKDEIAADTEGQKDTEKESVSRQGLRPGLRLEAWPQA